MDSIIEDRLSVFDDEPDLNDWVEVMCGAAMAVIGIFHLVQHISYVYNILVPHNLL